MKLTAFAALAIVLFAAPRAIATSVGVSFSGRVSEVVAFDFSTGTTPLLATEIGESVAVGTRFSGFFDFDYAAPGPAGGNQATYAFRDPSWLFRTALGDYAPASDPAGGYELSVHDGDYYGYGVALAGVAHSPSGAGASSLDSLTINLALYGNSPDLLSTALDTVPWDLAAYS